MQQVLILRVFPRITYLQTGTLTTQDAPTEIIARKITAPLLFDIFFNPY